MSCFRKLVAEEKHQGYIHNIWADELTLLNMVKEIEQATRFSGPKLPWSHATFIELSPSVRVGERPLAMAVWLLRAA